MASNAAKKPTKPAVEPAIAMPPAAALLVDDGAGPPVPDLVPEPLGAAPVPEPVA